MDSLPQEGATGAVAAVSVDQPHGVRRCGSRCLALSSPRSREPRRSEPHRVPGRVVVLRPQVNSVVRLCDVHPDGTSYNLCDGVARVAATAGEANAVEVDLWSSSMLSKKGHRIWVQVTSSSFPRWDRNLNTRDGFTRRS
ncbi:CocE/NonD family hydrolase C-terminal non-catalytic domain-containing protein [Streptomyces sp. NPDC002680]|uniref:CocE/NonD family hydrolase C-terminal non-catalytic domain-containing protein n=1 Tax=Streptomyces sp. NPDC002680 TaxID=3364659 RepID=UPI0036A31176